MSKYKFEGILSEIGDNDNDAPAWVGFFFLAMFIILLVASPWSKIVSHIANNYFIPKYSFFWVDSIGCKIISGILFFLLVIVLVTLVSKFFCTLFYWFDESIGVIIIISVVVFVGGVFTISRFTNLPVYSDEAMHLKWSKTTWKLQVDCQMDDGGVLPQGTLFVPVSFTKRKYTGECKAVAYLNKQLQPVTFCYAYGTLTTVENNIIQDTFKSLIHKIYTQSQKLFIERLRENNLYPQEHDINDAFFKEKLSNTGGIIIENTFFDHFMKTSKFYYFETEKDFKAFKKIYNDTLKDYNVMCFGKTSEISFNGLSCYGI